MVFSITKRYQSKNEFCTFIVEIKFSNTFLIKLCVIELVGNGRVTILRTEVVVLFLEYPRKHECLDLPMLFLHSYN